MKVELIKDLTLNENFLKLFFQEIDAETQAILDLAKRKKHLIPAYHNQRLQFVAIEKIQRIFTEDKRVWIETQAEVYLTKQRLYDFKTYESLGFVQISQGEIVNISAIQALNLNLKGTIEIIFKNGRRSFVARRRLKSFKNALELNRKRRES